MKTKKRKILIISLLVLMMVFIIYGLYESAYGLSVTRYEVSSQKLSHSVRIVQLTDLHNSTFGENNTELTAKVKQQHPDIIVITGDLLNADEKNTDIATGILSQLSEIAPVYVSYGNHEMQYEDTYHTDLTSLYEQAGASVLEYTYQDITVKGQSIRLGGIYGYCMPEEYLKTKEANEQECAFLRAFQSTNQYKILLTHMPFVWIYCDGISKWDIDCVFTGHTHGGQIRLPFIGGLYAPDAGWFPGREKGMYASNDDKKVMILSSGLGNNTILPRFNNVPEIVVTDFLPA